MNKEQFDRCKKWEQHFRWAIRSNFCHMSNAEFNEIASIYKEVFGESLSKAQMTCNTCRLKALKKLGESYEAEVQRIAEEEKNKRLENIETEQVKKKAGRKKKIDID